MFLTLFRICAHREIVSAASPYFKALLMGRMREARRRNVTLTNVDGDTLRALIRYCYLGKIDIAGNVEVLLTAASSMELVQVEKHCERHCLKRLSRENCLHLWLLADRFNLGELKKKAFVVALDSFPLIVGGNDFLLLERGPLKQLLLDDHLSVACEEDVLEAVVRWVNFDEGSHKSHFAELLTSVVRVEHLKPEVHSTIVFLFLFLSSCSSC